MFILIANIFACYKNEYYFQMMFIKRIGGASGTDNVKAILKRIFTNELGTHCSWLGQRNNFKICDLSLIAAIKSMCFRLFAFKFLKYICYYLFFAYIYIFFRCSIVSTWRFSRSVFLQGCE